MRIEATVDGDTGDVVRWRCELLLRSGFPARLAAAVSRDGGYDVHRLLELVERGCPAELAVRIVAPLDGERAARAR